MFSIPRCYNLLLTIAFVLCLAMPTLAETRWINGTQSQEILCIKADPLRDRIYYGDGATNQIVVVDTNTETVVKRIQVFGKPQMMDISKDGNTLAVAHSTIAFIDLSTYTVRELTVGKVVTDVAFDYAGLLYISTSEGWGRIYKINPLTGATLKSFGAGLTLANSIYSNALVETDSSGRYLYVGERGLSPASLYKFDISGTTPVFLAEDDHGAIGSNLQDFSVHANGKTVYMACGSPYEIQVIAADTIDKINSLPTGPYPNGVTIDPSGLYAYATANSQNLLFKFDLTTRAIVNTERLLTVGYNDDPLGRGLAVDRTGSKVFVVHGNTYSSSRHAQIQVVATTKLPDIDNDGVPDINDNCLDRYNSDQSDLDRDGLGDACDPYPSNSNNLDACFEENDGLAADIAALSEERNQLLQGNQTLSAKNGQLTQTNQFLSAERIRLTQANQALAEVNLTLRKRVADTDSDGIFDGFDACRQTTPGLPVDPSGCSQVQFCANYTSPAECLAADWKNNDPLHANDCQWKNKTCRFK